jgi:hypothetical protein
MPVPASRNDDVGASSSALSRIFGQARQVFECNQSTETRVSIIDPEPPAIRTGETVETGKSALVLAAIFIVVEIVLMAEAISVILLEGSERRNPGAAPIAILLSTALLANLGLVCTFIAASAASAVRRSRLAGAIPVASFAAVSSSGAVDVVGSAGNLGSAASSNIPTSG